MSDQRLGRPRTITRDIESLMQEWAASYTTWSPTQMWQKLTEAGHSYSLDAVQVAMSRMLHAGDLERVSYGIYKPTGAEPVTIEFTPLVVRLPHSLQMSGCGACSAVVIDTEAHASWHEEQR